MLTYREAWYIKDLSYQDRMNLACKMVRLEHYINEAATWFARAFEKDGIRCRPWKLLPNEFKA